MTTTPEERQAKAFADVISTLDTLRNQMRFAFDQLVKDAAEPTAEDLTELEDDQLVERFGSQSWEDGSNLLDERTERVAELQEEILRRLGHRMITAAQSAYAGSAAGRRRWEDWHPDAKPVDVKGMTYHGLVNSMIDCMLSSRSDAAIRLAEDIRVELLGRFESITAKWFRPVRDGHELHPKRSTEDYTPWREELADGSIYDVSTMTFGELVTNLMESVYADTELVDPPDDGMHSARTLGLQAEIMHRYGQ